MTAAEQITFVVGVLGWSNKRSGVEFYRYDPKVIPRHGSEWGDLLALEGGVAGKEGSVVVVAVLPRPRGHSELVAEATLRIMDALRAEVVEEPSA